MKNLIVAAREGMHNAFTGHNKKDDARFGAAVLTKKGNIYASGQYFSDTLSLTLHAEQAAVSHAAAHGEYAIAAIACVGNEQAHQLSKGIIYPCHICKQVLWESYLRSGVNTDILIVDIHDNVIETISLLNIMKYSWPNI